ncbi:hypothetical protein [Streptomyces sp. NBRC 110028]|uniref:hypothetical protein n=1 Tax=Streptomyces sp. NBRC 110028 TaxID=1621260 RepID=UPI00131AC669|nr:hypothetical protein [Streptomyces sp. NBRC 110028]
MTAVVREPARGVLTGRVQVALLRPGRGARRTRAARAVDTRAVAPGGMAWTAASRTAASRTAASRTVDTRAVASRTVDTEALASRTVASRTVDEHLRVLLPTPVPSLAPLADVLLAGAEAGTEPRRQTAALAARHPGALVVAVHRGLDLWMRLGPDGRALTLRARCPAAGPPWAVWAVWASVAHAWLVAGLPAGELGAAPLRLMWVQPAVPSVAWSSSRPSRVRTASAWADFERPTAE